ncbi:MAG: 4Fe-4S binding protein, partial [Planctomycetota bacterium]
LTVVGVFVFKGNAERWCPFGGVEAVYNYFAVGSMTCSLGVSNFYILGTILLLTLLLRRAFCGYMCPLGAIFEWLQAGVRKLGLRSLGVPYRLDRALALLKYVVLVVILYFTWTAGELLFRGYDPCYVLISRHGKDITMWAYVISGVFVLASLFIVVPFCRWFCPLAAVFTPFSRFGLARVKRSAETCIDCGICNKACPMGIQVDRVAQVTAARCTSCLDCIPVCPKKDVGALSWGPPNWLGHRWPRVVIIAAVLLSVGVAVAASYAFPLPSFVSSWGERPGETATARLEIHGLTCAGQTRKLESFLLRSDELALAGYIQLEAWPGTEPAAAHITYDPALISESALKTAITEPYYDLSTGEWMISPFEVVGYDPLDLGD